MKRGSLPKSIVSTGAVGHGWLPLSVLAILLITLFPDPSSNVEHGLFLRSVIPKSLKDVADTLLNILLFVPLGVALSGRGLPLTLSTLCALLLTSAIEAMQMFVPGRYPSLRDILANTFGTALGAQVLASAWGEQHLRRALHTIDRCVAQPDAVAAKPAAAFSLGAALIASALILFPAISAGPRPPGPAYVVSDAHMDPGTGPLRIGGDGSADGFFAGTIDEVRIFNAARSATEIRRDMEQAVGGTSVREATLVAAYGFDADGTAAHDDSGRGNHGAVHGAAWTEAGKFGGALQFDGRGGEVVVPSGPDVTLREQMTLEAWVRPTGEQTPEATVISRARGYFLRASSEGQPSHPAGGSRFGARYEDARPELRLADGTWTHMAVSYDGQTIRVYLNGMLSASNQRWSPHRTIQASLNGVSVQPGLLRNAALIGDAMTRSLALSTTIRCGARTWITRPVFAITGPGDADVLRIQAIGDDLIVGGATRAAALGLPSPEYRLPRALAACPAGSDLSLRVEGRVPNLRATVNGAGVSGSVPGPGSGWSVLRHGEMLPGSIDRLLTFLWLAALLFPFGLWARRHRSTAVGAMVLIVALFAAAAAGDLRRVSFSDAAAMATGVGAALLYRRARLNETR